MIGHPRLHTEKDAEGDYALHRPNCVQGTSRGFMALPPLGLFYRYGGEIHLLAMPARRPARSTIMMQPETHRGFRPTPGAQHSRRP